MLKVLQSLHILKKVLPNLHRLQLKRIGCHGSFYYHFFLQNPVTQEKLTLRSTFHGIPLLFHFSSVGHTGQDTIGYWRLQCQKIIWWLQYLCAKNQFLIFNVPFVWLSNNLGLLEVPLQIAFSLTLGCHASLKGWDDLGLEEELDSSYFLNFRLSYSHKLVICNHYSFRVPRKIGGVSSPSCTTIACDVTSFGGVGSLVWVKIFRLMHSIGGSPRLSSEDILLRKYYFQFCNSSQRILRIWSGLVSHSQALAVIPFLIKECGKLTSYSFNSSRCCLDAAIQIAIFLERTTFQIAGIGPFTKAATIIAWSFCEG